MVVVIKNCEPFVLGPAFAIDTIYRLTFLAHFVPNIQNGMRQRSELRESDPPLQLPPLEQPPTLFVSVKLINDFLIAL
jgi:hypothetical protein